RWKWVSITGPCDSFRIRAVSARPSVFVILLSPINGRVGSGLQQAASGVYDGSTFQDHPCSGGYLCQSRACRIPVEAIPLPVSVATGPVIFPAVWCVRIS